MADQPVHVTRAEDIVVSGGQTDGMTRKNAIVGVSDKVMASVMIAEPHSCSAVHHHGEQDTIVYAAKGYGTVISQGGKKKERLNPGDFALVPAWAEHQEANESDEQVVWIITRSGSHPIVKNLEGWGKS